MPSGAAARGVRALAREQITAEILANARAQLATAGPAQLSVRAVARDVGMVSSAVYRYFPSRDELLTELLVICYDELGSAVEAAEAAPPRDRYRARWLALARAFRRWALDHPHDYALLYGSPVPGYAAPRRTVEPALRVPGVAMGLLRDLPADRRPEPDPDSAAGPADPALHDALAAVGEFAGSELPDHVLVAGLQAWSGLVGAVTLELFGHLANGIADFDVYFDALADRLSPVRGADAS